MAEEDDKKKMEKDNQEQLMMALALLLYPKVDENTLSYESIPQDVKKELTKKIGSYVKEENEDMTNMTKSDILKTAKEIADVKTKYFKVVSVGDDKTCDTCKKWDGKIICDEDDNYPSYSDFENSGACHPNCRCYLKPISINKSMNNETDKLDEMAMNSEPITDTVVYRGFVDETLDSDITYDFGETLVMITPIGEFTGSTVDGKPVKEIVDEESVKTMAQQTEEVLLDRDHASMRTNDRDSSAAGWISGFKAVVNLGDMSGLYAIVKWTSEGIRLVKDRIYRFLSPVFELDANGRAIRLVNVGLTNRPALKMMPILNNESNNNTISITETKTMEDKHIENGCSDKKNEVRNEEVDVKKETVEETVVDEPKEEPEVDEPKDEPKEEPKDEPKDEPKEEPEVEEQEVIKEEVLNNAPTIGTDISGKAEWENLTGDAFWAWYKNYNRIQVTRR